MRADPFSGAVYVFRAKRADWVKLIFRDGTGVCLFAKRFDDGHSGRRTCKMVSCTSRPRSFRHFWKGLIGAGFTPHARHRRRRNQADRGRVNQVRPNTRGAVPAMI
jgi:hypothetical protein